MNENAKKWVAALRSGDYEKTTRHLRTKNGFCCLGVACDLYEKATGKGKWKLGYYTYLPSVYAFHSGYPGTSYKDEAFPAAVMRWIGLRDAIGEYSISPSIRNSLTNNNDNGSSFAEIADVIESEPEGLFRIPS